VHYFKTEYYKRYKNSEWIHSCKHFNTSLAAMIPNRKGHIQRFDFTFIQNQTIKTVLNKESTTNKPFSISLTVSLPNKICHLQHFDCAFLQNKQTSVSKGINMVNLQCYELFSMSLAVSLTRGNHSSKIHWLSIPSKLSKIIIQKRIDDSINNFMGVSVSPWLLHKQE